MEKIGFSLVISGVSLSYIAVKRLVLKTNPQSVLVALLIGGSLIAIGLELLILALR